jgi:hypothetical protein
MNYRHKDNDKGYPAKTSTIILCFHDHLLSCVIVWPI